MSYDKKMGTVEMTPEEFFKKLKGIGMKESTMEAFQSFPQYSLKGDKDPRWKEKQYKIFRKGKFFLTVFYEYGRLHSFRSFGKTTQVPDGLDDLIFYVKTYDDDMDPDIIY